VAVSNPLDATRRQTWTGGPSFGLSNRLYRLSFWLTWLILASWTPPPLRRWRAFILRCFGAKLAPTANVYGSARIWSPANLTMQDYAAIGPRVIVYSMADIVLESYSVVSQGSHLCAGTHDIEDPFFQLKARPIRIGSRAWIAAEAFVGPGVEVGEGAVLGARGCAMRSIAAWTVCTGNPAAVVRTRQIRFPASGNQPAARV
jgi:putative colanic acid biosynthesis acetyltransferase WcaF